MGHFLVCGGRTQRSSILHNLFARFPVGDPFESQHMHFLSSFRRQAILYLSTTPGLGSGRAEGAKRLLLNHLRG